MDEKKKYSKFRIDFEHGLHKMLSTSHSDAQSFYLSTNTRPVMCQLWICLNYNNENVMESELSGVESVLTKFFHFNKEGVTSIVKRLQNERDIFCGIFPEDSAEIRSHDVNIYFRGIGLLSTCRIYKDEFYVTKRD